MLTLAISGTWWTRWFNYNNYDLLKIVSDYQTRSIPLDVFVLDMDWHTKNDWTGYSWDTRLFPYPADTMASLKVGPHLCDCICICADGDLVCCYCVW